MKQLILAIEGAEGGNNKIFAGEKNDNLSLV